MPQTIKHKRSASSGSVPSTSSIVLGEIALNTTDGLMFSKKSVSGTESICTFHPTTDDSTTRTLTLDKGSLNAFNVDFADSSLSGSYIDGNAGRILTNSTGMYLYGATNLALYSNSSVLIGGYSASTVTMGGTNCNTITLSTNNTGRVVLPSKIQFSANGRTPTRTDSPTFEMKLEDNEIDNSDMTFSEGIRLSSYAFGVMPKTENTMNNTGGYAYTAITLENDTNVKGLMNYYFARENTSYYLRPYTGTSSQISLKMDGNVELGRNTNYYPIIQPWSNAVGYLGTSSKKFYACYAQYMYATGLYVTSFVDLADYDNLRFGTSDDVKMFYDGSANEMEMELESFCNRFKITDNGTTRFTFLKSSGDFTATGNVTAYSDERLKSDIKTLDPGKTLEMRGVEFTKDGRKGSGVIAQELEKVAPELVVNEGEYKSVAYGNLSGYLIETIKDQQTQINELKELVNKLLEK